jgi:hypothetical protein
VKDRVYIDVACNDPDNGLFAGQAMFIQIGDIELDGERWPGFAFTEGDGWIRLHRRKFRIVGSKDWVGNWCWNRYALDRAEAKRLIATLRTNRWRCTCGPSRWCEWFNSEGRWARATGAESGVMV